MLKISTANAVLKLNNQQSKELWEYITNSNIDYKFVDGSDFDYIINKRDLALLIDEIFSDADRDRDMVEVLTLTLTELVANKEKSAMFYYVEDDDEEDNRL